MTVSAGNNVTALACLMAKNKVPLRGDELTSGTQRSAQFLKLRGSFTAYAGQGWRREVGVRASEAARSAKKRAAERRSPTIKQSVDGYESGRKRSSARERD